MSTKSSIERSRRAAAALIAGVSIAAAQALAVLAHSAHASARAAMPMPMNGSTPEHVAAALAAFKHHHPEMASVDLRMAMAMKAEPTAARGHAREALYALKGHDVAVAEMHAANGAAVEHLTYALRALHAGHLTGSMSAADHLGEAVALPRVRKDAKAAIRAIKRRDIKAARQHILAGLKTANKG